LFIVSYILRNKTNSNIFFFFAANANTSRQSTARSGSSLVSPPRGASVNNNSNANTNRARAPNPNASASASTNRPAQPAALPAPFVRGNQVGNNANGIGHNNGPSLNAQGGGQNNARARYAHVPVDGQMLQTPVFGGRFREISLTDLCRENVLVTTNLRRRFLDAQILRCITPKSTNRTANVLYRHKKLGNRLEDVSYARIYLMRVYSENNPLQNSKLFYVLQGTGVGGSNAHLWNRNPEHRDNGTITIGSFVRLANPAPVEKFMQNIPMVYCDITAIALRQHPSLGTIPINKNLDGNAAMAFTYNSRAITINRMSVIATRCAGLHCDKQNLASENRAVCGCFCNSAFRSNLAFVFGLSFRSDEGDYRIMNNFTSLSFQKMFFNAPIPPEVTAASLQGTDIGLDIEDSIINQNDLVNNNGGYSIVGWCKRGVINDQSLVGAGGTTGKDNDDGRVNAEDVTIHIVQILPTNRDFFNPTSQLGNQFRNMRFNVLNMLNH